MGMMDPAGPFGRPMKKSEGPQPEGRLIAALDLGASKVTCLIGRADEDGEVMILGVGSQRPQSGQDGAPVNFEACVRAMRIAVDHAERMAGETIHSVTASYGGPGLKSQRLTAALPLPPGPIGARAVRMAIAASLKLNDAPRRVVLHAIPAGYRIDGGPLLSDPRGYEGRHLCAEMIVVTAPQAAIEALTDCIGEAGLRVGKVVAAPYAAGLAVLSPEEREIGAVVMDCGAGHVGVAAFKDGCLILADQSPIGGAALTQDIAEQIGSSFAAAERLKVVQGGFGQNRPETFEAARIGREGRLEGIQMSRAALIEAFGPRLEAMLIHAGGKLAPVSTLEGDQPWRLALTGGASLMPGMRDIAQTLLHRPARNGRPVGFGVLDDSPIAAAYAVAAGLLRYEAENPPEISAEPEQQQAPRRQPTRIIRIAPQLGPKFQSALHWFKDNF